VIVRLVFVDASQVMTVLHANVPFAQATVMIVVPAGQKSTWQARLVVPTSPHGTPSNTLVVYVMLVTVAQLVINKNAHLVWILLLVMVMKLVVNALEEVCVITLPEPADASADSLVLVVNTKPL